jgi:hypothetical protein
MKRAISIAFGVIPSVLLLLALAVPAQAQSPWSTGEYAAQYPPPPNQAVPNIDGIWYNHSNGGRCEVIQRWPDTRARFINENGDRAWGFIERDRVFIPDWNNGEGQRGWVRGNRIVWPDGNYWER